MATKRGAIERGREDLIKQFPGLVPEEGRVTYPAVPEGFKLSSTMRAAELLLGQPITQIIARDKRGVDIAKKLGVTTTTICKWRRDLDRALGGYESNDY